MMIDENKAPLRSEIVGVLDAEKEKNTYKSKNATNKKKQLVDAHKAFLDTKGLTATEVTWLMTDHESYEPPTQYVERQA